MIVNWKRFQQSRAFINVGNQATQFSNKGKQLHQGLSILRIFHVQHIKVNPKGDPQLILDCKSLD